MADTFSDVELGQPTEAPPRDGAQGVDTARRTRWRNNALVGLLFAGANLILIGAIAGIQPISIAGAATFFVSAIIIIILDIDIQKVLCVQK